MAEEKDAVQQAAKDALARHQAHQKRQLVLWIGALAVGAVLGTLGIGPLNDLFNFIATVFTRLFQFIAVPTIALAVITTLAALGADKSTGRIFAHAVTYTLLTTISAAAIGLVLYLWIAPGNLPADVIGAGAADVPLQKVGSLSYYDHFLTVIPNNLLQPFLSGNVLSVMLIAAAVGLALAFMPKTENRAVLLKSIEGAQEVLFTLIRALLWALPLGILLGLSRPAHAACQLVLEFFRNVPPLALLPMLILWFGIGESSKLIIVILATFFPIFLNTLAAISRPNAGLLELAQVFRLSPGAAFWHLRLPMAMPAIYTGLRIGLGYSWRSLIGAEMIAAAAGLGWLILDGEEMARPDVVLAGIFVLGLLGILTDAAIRALGRRCWRFTGGE